MTITIAMINDNNYHNYIVAAIGILPVLPCCISGLKNSCLVFQADKLDTKIISIFCCLIQNLCSVIFKYCLIVVIVYQSLLCLFVSLLRYW